MKQFLVFLFVLVLIVPLLGSSPSFTVRTSGTLLISPTGAVDLDSGKVIVDGSLRGIDLWYEAARPGVFYVRSLPNRNSKIANVGMKSPDFDTCKNATFTNQPIDTKQLTDDSYLCVQTDQGRLSRVRIEGFTASARNQASYPDMAISFTTWEK